MNILFSNKHVAADIIAVPCAHKDKKAHLLTANFSQEEKEKIAKQLLPLNFSGKKAQTVFMPQANGQIYLLFGLGDINKLSFKDWSAVGASLYKALGATQAKKVVIQLDAQAASDKFPLPVIAAEMAFGLEVRSYRFDHYRTQLKEEQKPQIKEITFVLNESAEAQKNFKKNESLAQGIFFARDLMCAPPNELYPESMAQKIKALEKIGLEVEILTVKEMEKYGMGGILAVGQGSQKPPRLVIMKWRGAPTTDAPVAFVGKGVTFDTGGISLKPGNKMDEMKMDMGGSAIVAGLMKTIALRQAKVNAVGVVALAENMPDGNAYRPGDIIKTMSGQTIEVLNTDAEGRIVLSDALWYTQETFKPKFMIDLATLTGAMVIALGNEFAGIFTNKDNLSKELSHSGEKVGERVWRLPLDPNYNKLIDSDVADMKNISVSGGAHSITAAEFLQRFVNKTPWVHIDIAGVTWMGKEHPLSGKYPSGFGVRLLDDLLQQHYESKK